MSQLIEVPELYLNSDTESTEVSTDEEIPLKRKTVEKRVWLFEKSFDSFSEAMGVIGSENCWSRSNKRNSFEGEKIFFRCNKTPYRTEHRQCPSGIYLLLHADSTSKVSLFRTQSSHEDHIDVRSRGIPDNIKKVILDLFSDGITKPKAILTALRNRNLEEPEKSQLCSFLASKKLKKFGKATISIAELEEFCSTRMEVPNDLDKPFVVSSQLSVDFGDQIPDLKIFLTTPRLLELGKVTLHLHCDATYKLNWHGYPVIVVGTTDKNRSFFPLGLAVCYSEAADDYEFIFNSLKEGLKAVFDFDFKPEFLIGDAADAITNGFEAAFGNNFVRVMCWFHVQKAVRSNLRKHKIKNEDAQLLQDDINLLQIAQSDQEFDQASNLFLEKWNTESDDGLKDFLKYFENEWLVKQRFWYEGASLGYPSNNNALEAINRVIKDEYTLRERLPVKEFLSILEEKLLPDWSRERDQMKTNCKIYATTPSRTLADWTSAYQWAATGMKLLSEVNEDGATLCYVASTIQLQRGGLTDQLVQEYKDKRNKWSSFEEFLRLRQSVWVVTIPAISWEFAFCNCPVYLKKYQCKHSLGLAIRLRLTTAPPGASTLPLGQKRKRGRPQKAKAALMKQ